VTEGLDGLPARLAEYYKMGARFTKWRAVFTIADGIPTDAGIKTNATILARYAAACQEAGLVPIVEPEVLMDGNHTLAQCAEVTMKVLHAVFDALYEQRIYLEGIILKPNMVLPGADCPVQNNADEIAHATIETFLQSVPAVVTGIAFLSGGQEAELASERLNMMHRRFDGNMPWALTFSFSRAIQQPALELWKGDDANIAAAQQMLYHRAACNNAARRGEYTADLEKTLLAKQG
jgi:fructose-bisphosphate aldolase class I